MGKYDSQIAALEQAGAQAPALPASKGKYDEQIAALEAPQAQAQPEKSFFNPSEMLGRAADAAQSLPFVQAGKNVFSGKPAYESTPEGVARAAGDVGGASAIGAGIASEGVLPAIQGLAKFTGLSAAMNALGIPQGANKVGEQLQKASDFVQVPSKVAGIDGFGDVLNVISRIPGAVGASAMDVVPYLLAGKATGAAEPAVSSLGESPKPSAQVAESPATPQSLLQQHGGELSPAMRATGRFSKAVASGVEKLAGMNPLTAALPEGIQAKNVGAVQNYLEKSLGPDVAGLSMADYGPKLAQALKEYKGERSDRFGGAEKALSGIESRLPKPVGQMASDRIISMLQEKGVPSDQNGFNPDLMTGNEKIDPTSAKALVAMERQVRNAQNIPDLLAQRQNIDKSGIINFQAPPDAVNGVKKMARGIVNDTLTQAVESSGDQNAIDAWKKANAEYSETAPVMRALGKTGANQLLGPEALTKIFTDKAKGGQALDRLKANMSPEQWNSIQDASINAILDKSRGSDGAISSDALKTNLSKNMAHVFSRLEPEKQTVLQNAQAMMDKAKLADLKRANSSGSGTEMGKGIHTASLFNPLAWLPLLGETAGIGGYYGANKALPPVLDAMGSAKNAAVGAMRGAIPGTKPLPPYILDMVKRAAARPSLGAAR